MTTDKSFVSAQMDTDLIKALGKYAETEGITRSAAVRRAIEQLLDTKAA
ncbi:MAG: ribbon-helix-helix protein, CopG family [Ilumatobacteraceae bacterium]|jgi:hypothetical protein